MSKFTQYEEELLKLFQSEANRRAEEEFARIFTENDNVRVAFINEDRAFTDGRNIVVDPAGDKLFSDKRSTTKSRRITLSMIANIIEAVCEPPVRGHFFKNALRGKYRHFRCGQAYVHH